jgi:anti-sigma factor RsiW
VTTGAPPPPPADDVPCAVFVELITDYLDGTIPSDLRARVDGHLALCPGCASVLEQMRRVIQLASRLTDHDIGTLPARNRDRLLAAFRAARQGG